MNIKDDHLILPENESILSILFNESKIDFLFFYIFTRTGTLGNPMYFCSVSEHFVVKGYWASQGDILFNRRLVYRNLPKTCGIEAPLYTCKITIFLPDLDLFFAKTINCLNQELI